MQDQPDESVRSPRISETKAPPAPLLVDGIRLDDETREQVFAAANANRAAGTWVTAPGNLKPMTVEAGEAGEDATPPVQTETPPSVAGDSETSWGSLGADARHCRRA